jgi:hypothetical protein
MNKFLWNLFGIKDGDIPELPDPSRRGFLRLLGGAAAVGVITPTHFLAPLGGWPQDRLIHTPLFSYDDLTSVAKYMIVPQITDNFFKPSLLFHALTRGDHHRARILSA